MVVSKSPSRSNEEIALVNHRIYSENKYSRENSGFVSTLEEALSAKQEYDLVVLDNTKNEFTIEGIKNLFRKMGMQTKIVVHIQSNEELGYDRRYNSLIQNNKNVSVVHTFPAYTKINMDSPSAVLLAHPDTISDTESRWGTSRLFMDGMNVAILEEFLFSLPDFNGVVDHEYLTSLMLKAKRLDDGESSVLNWNENIAPARAFILNNLKEIYAYFASTFLFQRTEHIQDLETLLRKIFRYPAGDFVFTRGVSESIRRSIFALSSPGDSILLANPTYPSYLKAAEANQLRIHQFYFKQQDSANPTSLGLDIEALLKQISETKPKILILLNPDNPLGNVINASDFKRIMDHTKQVSPETTVIADAVGDIFAIRAGIDYPSYDQYLQDYNLVVLNGPSKSLGLTAPRAGFIYGNALAMRRIKSLSEDSSISYFGLISMLFAYHPIALRELKETIRFVLTQKEIVHSRFEQWQSKWKEFHYKKDLVGHFVLFEIDRALNTEVAAYLGKQNVYVTAERSTNFIRASLGTAFENDRLLQVLGNFLLEKFPDTTPAEVVSQQTESLSESMFNFYRAEKLADQDIEKIKERLLDSHQLGEA